ASLDLHVRYEIQWNGVGGAECAAEHVRDFDAIEVVGVLEAARSIHLNAADTGAAVLDFAANTRRQRQNRVKGPAFRQAFERARRNAGVRAARGCIEGDCRLADLHDFGRRTDGQSGVVNELRTDAHFNVALFEGAESGLGDRQVINADWNFG